MTRMPHVLVVDDDPWMVRTLVDIFNAKGCEAEGALCGAEALAKVQAARADAARRFHCVLTDIKMPQMNGVEFQRAIKALQPDLAVVLMTAYATDRLVREGLEQGALAVLTKPLEIDRLLGFFAALRRERAIVIVDDDPQFCGPLGTLLRPRGFEVTQITDPRGVAQALARGGQVVLLDMKLNGVTGLEVLQSIRERHPDLPVILVTAYREEMAEAIEACLRIGATTCLYKPFEIEELLDVLTLIGNRELTRALGLPRS